MLARLVGLHNVAACFRHPDVLQLEFTKCNRSSAWQTDAVWSHFLGADALTVDVARGDSGPLAGISSDRWLRRVREFLGERKVMKPAKGFTLIELMIVVAIVAILAMIAYPSYLEQIRKNRRAQAKADLMELVQGLERSFTTDRTYANYALGFTQSPRDAASGFYGLAITRAAGKPSDFKLTATPQGAQTADRCGALTIDSVGARTHGAGANDYCQWGNAVAP